MKDSKKLLKTTVLVLLLVLLGVELCMEIRYPCKETAVVSKDTEAILRRTPEVEITEEDRATVEDLSQCAVVQSLLESGENGDLPAADHPELMEAADRHLSPESAATVVVSAMFYEGSPSLYVNWTDGGGHTLILGRERDGEEYYKLYGAGGKYTCENWNNERAQKSVVRRRWLGWLRDDLW